MDLFSALVSIIFDINALSLAGSVIDNLFIKRTDQY